MPKAICPATSRASTGTFEFGPEISPDGARLGPEISPDGARLGPEISPVGAQLGPTIDLAE